MFITLSKRLKSMSGFRLGVGLRITKNNWWYFLFILLFVGCFYFCWWCFVGCCWLVYFIFYAIYKLYYFMFKYAAIGIKKLYSLIKEAVTRKSDN